MPVVQAWLNRHVLSPCHPQRRYRAGNIHLAHLRGAASLSTWRALLTFGMAHLTELCRDSFTQAGATPIASLAKAKHGQRVKIGGLLATLQRPPTAKVSPFSPLRTPRAWWMSSLCRRCMSNARRLCTVPLCWWRVCCKKMMVRHRAALTHASPRSGAEWEWVHTLSAAWRRRRAGRVSMWWRGRSMRSRVDG